MGGWFTYILLLWRHCLHAVGGRKLVPPSVGLGLVVAQRHCLHAVGGSMLVPPRSGLGIVVAQRHCFSSRLAMHLHDREVLAWLSRCLWHMKKLVSLKTSASPRECPLCFHSGTIPWGGGYIGCLHCMV